MVKMTKNYFLRTLFVIFCNLIPAIVLFPISFIGVNVYFIVLTIQGYEYTYKYFIGLYFEGVKAGMKAHKEFMKDGDLDHYDIDYEGIVCDYDDEEESY